MLFLFILIVLSTTDSEDVQESSEQSCVAMRNKDEQCCEELTTCSGSCQNQIFLLKHISCVIVMDDVVHQHVLVLYICIDTNVYGWKPFININQHGSVTLYQFIADVQKMDTFCAQVLLCYTNTP